MMKYSLFNLLRNATNSQCGWPEAWRSPPLKDSYDVIIIGGGGNGLATAYYLAKQHGITNVAVLEKGWLGGGNTGRNTTIIRSNYLLDESVRLYDLSVRLWERLTQELNFNLMFSQRGVLVLAHTGHELAGLERRANALRLNGVDFEMLTRDQIANWVPVLNTSPAARFPLRGGAVQRRGGIARHDALAWGYARAGDACGVDIIQNCAVTGIRRIGNRVVGVDTTRGYIGASKVGVAVAGHCSELAAMVDLLLPVESFPLQAIVSEPVKPILDTVIQSETMRLSISQSDRGELVMGAARDTHTSYSQRGSFAIIEDLMTACVELFPSFSRLKWMRLGHGRLQSHPGSRPVVRAYDCEKRTAPPQRPFRPRALRQRTPHQRAATTLTLTELHPPCHQYTGVPQSPWSRLGQ
jgi:sarcosine oxidase, subunit beta